MTELEKMDNFDIPILLLVFNRPSQTFEVFSALQKLKPSKIYIAADGPRANVPQDIEKCQEARSVINMIDWHCEVKTLFREQNLGCGPAISQAITWFFDQEEMGIILEDDILCSQDFFWFCKELLEKYRHDTRILQISGMNMLNGYQRDERFSYYFSRIGSIWGWATWRRAWNLYDYQLTQFDDLSKRGYFNEFIYNRPETDFILSFYKEHAEGVSDTSTWDYQWLYTRYIHSGLCIIPHVSLTLNIGFDDEATHKVKASKTVQDMELSDLNFPLKHPNFLIPDALSEQKQIESFFEMSPQKRLFYRYKKLIFRMIGEEKGKSIVRKLKSIFVSICLCIMNVPQVLDCFFK